MCYNDLDMTRKIISLFLAVTLGAVVLYAAPVKVNAADTLSVTLVANPQVALIGQQVSLTATVSGTAQGSIHYRFDCTNNGTYEYDTVTNNTSISVVCNYQTEGSYTARVYVERGTVWPGVTKTTTITAATSVIGAPSGPTSPISSTVPQVTNSAHGDTIDVKVNGSDGPLTIPAAPGDFVNLTITATATSTDSFWDNANPFSQNWPDIDECVDWNGGVVFTGYRGADNPWVVSAKVKGYWLHIFPVTCYFGPAAVGNESIQDSVDLNIVLPEATPPSSPPTQTLGAVLSVSPSPSGIAPFNPTLTATVSGTAQGTIHYQFDCTNNGSYEVDVVNNTNPYSTNICSYQTAGTYTARVHIERGTATPIDRTATIVVNPPPAAPGKPAVDIRVQ